MERQWKRIPLRSSRRPDAIDAITRSVEFVSSTGSMWATLTAYEPNPMAKLTPNDRQRYMGHRPNVVYVVWSGETPIAWRLRGGVWVEIAPVSPGIAMRRHLGILRRGIEQHSSEARARQAILRMQDWDRRLAAAAAGETIARLTGTPAQDTPPAQQVRITPTYGQTARRIAETLREYDEWHPASEVRDTRRDNFSPDNKAPVQRTGNCPSGEAAIYSIEYLSKRLGRSTA